MKKYPLPKGYVTGRSSGLSLTETKMEEMFQDALVTDKRLTKAIRIYDSRPGMGPKITNLWKQEYPPIPESEFLPDEGDSLQQRLESLL